MLRNGCAKVCMPCCTAAISNMGECERTELVKPIRKLLLKLFFCGGVHDEGGKKPNAT